MKPKLKNKVVYIPDEKTLEEMRVLIEKAGLQIDPDYKRIFKHAQFLKFSARFDMFILMPYAVEGQIVSINQFKQLLRPTWKKWVKRIGIAVILILSAVILFSCSNAKLAVKYEKRSQKWHELAIKKGMVVKDVRREPDAYELDTNEVGKPYLRPIYYDCPPCQELVYPKSKFEIWQENLTERNENKHETKQKKSDNKKDVQLAVQNRKLKSELAKREKQMKAIQKRLDISKGRQLTKQLNCWNWWDKLKFGLTVFIPAFILGLIFRWILKSVKKIKFWFLSLYSNSH